MERYKKIVGIVAVLVALVALTGATMAFAQDTWPPRTAGYSGAGARLAWDGPPGPGPGPGMRWMDQETMHEAIAEALGISEEELEAALAEGKTPFTLAEELGVDFEAVQAAMQAARAEAVKQAVEGGAITEEQAEWILGHQGSMGWHRGGAFGPGPDGRPGLGAGLWDGSVHTAIADLLGMTVEDFEAARAEGKSLVELAEEAGVTLEEVRDAVQVAHAEALQQAVEEGRITQEQADQMLERQDGFGTRGPRFGGRLSEGRAGFGGPCMQPSVQAP
jgi:hypothetical protein